MSISLIIKELIYFGFKQAYACLFGGALLLLILLSYLFWPEEAMIARYDALFVAALSLQTLFILTKLETWEEVRIIFVFHLVGTVMEIFKTHMGSWIYPEENLMRIGGVPLFSGFMYSAVGSYIARVWRIFEFRFTHFPDYRWMVLLSVLIYVNFFAHHYWLDLRVPLFGATALIFLRTQVYFKPSTVHYHMPLLVGFFLVSFFIWIAENFGTLGAIWTYPSQHQQWHLVSINKMGSWYLLMIISFVLVSLLHKRTKATKVA